MMISDRSLRRVLRSDERVALWGDLVRALAASLLIVGIAACLMYYRTLAKAMFTELHMNDFGKFYYSAQAFLHGDDMYAPSPATEIPITETETRQFANMNPPHFHLLLLPIAALTPLPALIVWSVASAVALALSLRLIARELNLRWTVSGLAWTISAVILVAATGIIIVTGQVTFLLMLPVTLAWAWARRGRWDAAAILLGLVASIKPFLAVFGLYFLVKRQYRAAVFMALAALAFVGLGFLVFGAANYRSWTRALSGVTWTWALMNGSIEGMLSRSLANPSTTSLVYAPHLVKPLTWTLSLVVAAIAAEVLVRDDSENRVDRAFALLILAGLLISPLGWIYYIWFAAGPLFALYRARGVRSPLRDCVIAIAVVGLLSPLFVTIPGRGYHLWPITLGSIYTWTILALWAATIIDWAAARRLSPQR